MGYLGKQSRQIFKYLKKIYIPPISDSVPTSLLPPFKFQLPCHQYRLSSFSLVMQWAEEEFGIWLQWFLSPYSFFSLSLLIYSVSSAVDLSMCHSSFEKYDAVCPYLLVTSHFKGFVIMCSSTGCSSFRDIISSMMKEFLLLWYFLLFLFGVQTP